MKVLDLFAGIGGFTLGLERAGFETVAFCEIEPYAQKVLRKNWPEVPIYDDVRDITAERLVSDGISVNVITGGFPCQDISVAGKREGIEGERSGLWTECARLIGELQPRYAIFENVPNLLNGERGAWFKRVLWDISSLGYDAEWHCIPASELGAHHHRDRVWIIAYPNRGDDPRLNGSASQRSGQITSQGTEYAGRGSGEQIMAYPDSNDRRRGHSTKSFRRDSWMEPGSGGERQSLAEAISIVAESFNKQKRGDKKKEQFPVITRRHVKRFDTWDSEPDVGRVAHGIPLRTHRLKCLGNAVVPQIPELIGRAILEADL